MFIISKIRFLHSIEIQLDINGLSAKLKGKLAKYHSPLNNSLFFIKFTTVEWLELIDLAKVLAEGKFTSNSLGVF